MSMLSFWALCCLLFGPNFNSACSTVVSVTFLVVIVTKEETYCQQDWPVRSPGHWTLVCWAVGCSGSCPDWVRMPLWVWGCHLKYLNQKEGHTKGEEEGKGRGGEGRVRGCGGQNRWRHNTERQNTWQHIKYTHAHTQTDTYTERVVSVDEAVSRAHREEAHQAKTVWEECVLSQLTQSCICHAKSQDPRDVFNPGTREKRKKYIHHELVSSLETSEGV